MIYIINVTQDLIDCGYRGRVRECPVALAISDKLGFEVHTGPWIIRICQRSHRTIPTPAEVSRRILHYDKTGKMQPFCFTINL